MKHPKLLEVLKQLRIDVAKDIERGIGHMVFLCCDFSSAHRTLTGKAIDVDAVLIYYPKFYNWIVDTGEKMDVDSRECLRDRVFRYGHSAWHSDDASGQEMGVLKLEILDKFIKQIEGA